ncbi:MAG: DUF421 domain-containing protein [Actinobacteria bacterium]|nr:DUF421 domain-containing protein [Actinomycetota bacterium]
MPWDWLTASWTSVARIAVSAIVIFVWLLLTVRVTGLRTFSKMAAVDFAVTIASGAVLATTITSSSTSVVQGAVALGVLFGIQAAFAKLRRNDRISAVVENAPLLLMAGDQMLHDNLGAARVSVDDVKAKLREANVLRSADVRAVVLETTGDISVLHGDGPLEPDLVDGVRGADRLEHDGSS